MNNELRKFLKENDISCNKITIKNGVSIITDGDDRYVIKKNKFSNLNGLYRYLESRSFDYYPRLLLESNRYNIFEYVDDIDMTLDEKAKDIMHVIGLLHAKTTYYKEIDIDDYKKIYEDVISNLNYLYNYYSDMITIIDKEIYMAPSHYLLARNINIIFSSIDVSRRLIERWLKVINEKRKVRVVTIHNNLDIDHYVRNDKSYLLSWDKSKVDLPIYDLLIFYRKYALYFDFSSLFSYYESIYPLLPEEKDLLFSLLNIPDKIEFNDSQYSMCNKIRKYMDYLYLTKDVTRELIPGILPPKNSAKDKAD